MHNDGIRPLAIRGGKLSADNLSDDIADFSPCEGAHGGLQEFT